MTLPLINLPEAKEFITLRSNVTDQDTSLNRLIMAASIGIEHTLSRRLDYGARVDTFDTRNTRTAAYDLYGESETGRTTLSSPQTFHLNTLFPDQEEPLEVRYDPERVFGDATIIAPSRYDMNWGTGALTLLSGTKAAIMALRVSYSAGIVPTFFADDFPTLSANAPADLKLACMFQVAFLFKRQRGDNVGHKAEIGMGGDKSSTPNVEWNVQQGLCQEALGLLAPYRTVRVGRG